MPKAQEKPTEMKAPTSTAHPQPPSGGVCSTGPSLDGDIVSKDEFPNAVQIQKSKGYEIKIVHIK